MQISISVIIAIYSSASITFNRSLKLKPKFNFQ